MGWGCAELECRSSGTGGLLKHSMRHNDCVSPSVVTTVDGAEVRDAPRSVLAYEKAEDVLHESCVARGDVGVVGVAGAIGAAVASGSEVAFSSFSSEFEDDQEEGCSVQLAHAGEEVDTDRDLIARLRVTIRESEEEGENKEQERELGEEEEEDDDFDDEAGGTSSSGGTSAGSTGAV